MHATTAAVAGGAKPARLQQLSKGSSGALVRGSGHVVANVLLLFHNPSTEQL